MNQGLGPMQRALVNAGLVEEPKQRKPRLKQFNCKKCGKPMIRIEGTNTMACSGDKCNNFYIFDKPLAEQRKAS